MLAVCAWVLGAGSAHAQSDTYWCSGHPSLKTCIVSATYDGIPLAADDPSFDVFAIPAKVSGARIVLWAVQAVPPADDLTAAAGKTFSVTIQTNVVPREEDGFGAAETITRSGPTNGEYQVTITGQPVSATSQDGCTFPAAGPTCTPVSPKNNSWILQGEIDDYNYSGYTRNPDLPAGFVDSFYGMDMYTNVAETSLPPSLIQVDGLNELQIQLTDHHYLHDGSTVVHGDFYLRLPAAFLASYWGINDPATLSTNGLNASIGAGTLTVTVEPGNTGVQVNITGVTFSRRNLKIKLGVVTPRAPTNVKGSRTSGTRANVTFTKSRPRGQRVTGYKLSCKATDGTSRTWKSRTRHSPLAVALLVPGQAYSCKLRAHSKAGYGPASKRFSIRR